MFSQLKACLNAIVDFNSQEEWEALQSRLSYKIVKKGERVLAEGEVENHVVFINKGLLRLYYYHNEKMYTGKFFTENTFASAYESFLTRMPSIHSIDALEDSELLFLQYDDLQWLFKKYPVYERLGRLVAEDLFIYICADKKRFIQTPEEQYKDFMKKHPDLLQRVPQYIIASFMGITAETFSRLRKRMSKRHLDQDQERKHALAS